MFSHKEVLAKNDMINTLISEEIRNLFRKYEACIQRMDFYNQGKLFTKDLIVAGPQGISHHGNNFLTRWLYHRSMRSFYSKVQMTSVKLIFLTESEISNEYSMVKAHWAATFQRTGDMILEYDISYLIYKLKGDAKIVLFIAHEDEMEVYRGLGILEGEE